MTTRIRNTGIESYWRLERAQRWLRDDDGPYCIGGHGTEDLEQLGHCLRAAVPDYVPGMDEALARMDEALAAASNAVDDVFGMVTAHLLQHPLPKRHPTEAEVRAMFPGLSTEELCAGDLIYPTWSPERGTGDA